MRIQQLPDFQFLRQLAESLWRAEAQRRGAAVLVGSGFSRLASIQIGTSPPPLWKHLADKMAAELCPEGTKVHDYPTKDPLRLAEEYRANFGKQRLTAFLRREIADARWEPGELHQRLVTLPWTDILTTNYDTLLERAVIAGVGHLHDVVRSTGDLVNARAPRIVKLHGTVNINADLILTEEDYRLYPRTHAPFVNLARQVFIENELCLLGFSGTDPNLLQWSGWVRDMLEGGQRLVYLVGVLDLPPAARRLLEARGVRPIDLSPLVADVSDGDQRHERATTLLLDYLLSAKPRAIYEWEVNSNAANSTDEGGDKVERAARLKATVLGRTLLWRSERQSYPGWLVCPDSKREMIRYATGHAAWHLQRVAASLSADETLDALVELVWRYETALWRMPNELLSLLREAVQKGHTNKSALVHLRCSLLSNARLDDDDDAFDAIAASIRGETTDLDALAHVKYQECLRLRDSMSWNDLEKALDQFPDHEPTWWIRKASLLASLRLWGEASSLLRRAAIDLRRRERGEARSLWARSRRAWATWLIALDWRSREKREWDVASLEETQALDHLFRCDPWQEHQHLQRVTNDGVIAGLKSAAGRYTPALEAGRYREGGSASDAGDVSFEVERVSDIAGVPIQFNSTTPFPMAVEALGFGGRRTVRGYGRLILRMSSWRDDVTVAKHFSRVPVARIPLPVVIGTIHMLVASVTYWRERARRAASDMRARSEAISELTGPIHALSALCIRLTRDKAADMYRFALDLGADELLHHHFLYDSLSKLLSRSAATIGPCSDISLVQRAIDFPLSTELSSNSREFWPQPLEELDVYFALGAKPDEAKWSRRVGELIDAVRQSGKGRDEAAGRLAALTAAGLLKTEELLAFSAALWAHTSGKPPLPANTRFYKHALLDLPCPAGIDKVAAVKQTLFSSAVHLPDDVDRVAEMRRAGQRKERDCFPEPPVAAKLLDELLAHQPDAWMIEKEHLFSTISIDRQTDVGGAIASLLVPALSAADVTVARGNRLLELCATGKLPSALPGLIRFAEANEALRQLVENQIYAALLGTNWQDVAYAAGAVAQWHKSSLRGEADLTARLVDALISVVQLNRDVGLVDALDHAAEIATSGNLLPAQAERLGKAARLVFDLSDYEAVEPMSRRAASISLVRRGCVRVARALAGAVGVSDEIAPILTAATTDPLPEVREEPPCRP